MRYDDYMANMDALLWSVERDPMLRSDAVAVLVFEGPIAPEDFRAAVSRCVARVPRLRQVARTTAMSTAPPRFVDDPRFDLDHHTPVLAVGGEAGLEDVLRIGEQVRAQVLDHARPLWVLQLVTGLASGGCAIVLKIHHSVTDAVGGLQMIIEPLLSPEPGVPIGDRVEPSEPRRLGVAELVGGAALHELRTAAGGAGRLGRLGAAVAARPRSTVPAAARMTASLARTMRPVGDPLSPLMTGRSLSKKYLTHALPTDGLRLAAKAAGGKLNDAFVAGVIGGLARYHDKNGQPVDALRMLMPVNLRQAGDAAVAGNAFSAATFVVPADIASSAERVIRMRELSARAQAEPGLRAFASIAGVASRVPPSVLTPLYRKMVGGVDVITSNVPGPPVPLYLGSARLAGFYAFGPIGSAAVNVTLMTYAGTAYLAISVDRAAVTDPDLLLACMAESFDELLALGRADTKVVP